LSIERVPAGSTSLSARVAIT